MEERLFKVGAIAGTHGIKGELKIFPITDDVQKFQTLKTLILGSNKNSENTKTEYKIESSKFHKQFILVKLQGVNDMNTAQELKGFDVFVTEDFAVPLAENEYYYCDLYDMMVVTESGEELGKIVNIIETGANDVYEIEGGFLIPAIESCVLEVDVENKKMLIHLMEGLRD